MGLLPVASSSGARARTRAFSTLRLDRNHNKVTREEQARLRTLRIGVVGVSAGHSIAHILAMEGLVGELRLADFDTVALSNLNRIPASVLDLASTRRWLRPGESPRSIPTCVSSWYPKESRTTIWEGSSMVLIW